MYTQQLVQACVHMVYRLHLYVHMHCISLLYFKVNIHLVQLSLLFLA